jgi:hypothetical protein
LVTVTAPASGLELADSCRIVAAIKRPVLRKFYASARDWPDNP